MTVLVVVESQSAVNLLLEAACTFVSVLIVAKLYRNKFVLLNFTLVTASARIYVAFSFFGNAFKETRLSVLTRLL